MWCKTSSSAQLLFLAVVWIASYQLGSYVVLFQPFLNAIKQLSLHDKHCNKIHFAAEGFCNNVISLVGLKLLMSQCSPFMEYCTLLYLFSTLLLVHRGLYLDFNNSYFSIL
ncbi:hypothetical protein KSP39_PZI012343 [Platanthera zijinensis]|uniref:Uncharacterized protein n=1 Tax=Platanthera zijinensis TaxID=2320716 RepID=A0AAP0G4N5_9ASPA